MADTTRHVTDPRFHLGPMDQLYELVLGMVEKHYDAETRSRFAAWLNSMKPTTAHLAVMLTEMAFSGKPMGERHLQLAGFAPHGEPVIHLLPSCGNG
jgi:hypothetical protein